MDIFQFTAAWGDRPGRIASMRTLLQFLCFTSNQKHYCYRTKECLMMGAPGPDSAEEVGHFGNMARKALLRFYCREKERFLAGKWTADLAHRLISLNLHHPQNILLIRQYCPPALAQSTEEQLIKAYQAELARKWDVPSQIGSRKRLYYHGDRIRQDFALYIECARVLHDYWLTYLCLDRDPSEVPQSVAARELEAHVATWPCCLTQSGAVEPARALLTLRRILEQDRAVSHSDHAAAQVSKPDSKAAFNPESGNNLQAEEDPKPVSAQEETSCMESPESLLEKQATLKQSQPEPFPQNPAAPKFGGQDQITQVKTQFAWQVRLFLPSFSTPKVTRSFMVPLLIVFLCLGVGAGVTGVMYRLYSGIREDGVMAHLESALAIIEDNSESIEDIDAFYAALWVAMRAGEFDAAERGAYRILGKKEFSLYTANAYHLLGMVNQRQGKPGLSTGFFQSALQLNLANQKPVGHIRNELAFNAFLQGLSEKGLDIQGSEEGLSGEDLGRYYDVRSLLFLVDGDSPKALALAEKSLEATTGLSPGGVFDALSTQALAQYCLGNKVEGDYLNTQAYWTALELKEPEKQMIALMNTCFLHRRQGQPSPLEQHIRTWADLSGNKFVPLYLDRVLHLADESAQQHE